MIKRTDMPETPTHMPNMKTSVNYDDETIKIQHEFNENIAAFGECRNGNWKLGVECTDNNIFSGSAYTDFNGNCGTESIFDLGKLSLGGSYMRSNGGYYTNLFTARQEIGHGTNLVGNWRDCKNWNVGIAHEWGKNNNIAVSGGKENGVDTGRISIDVEY